MFPMYLTIAQTAAYTGFSQREVTRWLNSQDPPPHITAGKARRIRRDALAEYLRRKEDGN